MIGFPRTEAEIAAGITPVNYAFAPGDVRRYGIVPNSIGASSSNTQALKNLLTPEEASPVGRIAFPNSTGADTYYFDDIIEIRDGVEIDGQHCTLHFEKDYSSSDDKRGFFTFIRNVTLRNIRFVVDYDGSSGVNAGMVLRIGGRDSYGFAGESGIFDADLPEPMGNIRLSDLTFTTNNPGPGVVVLLLGGLRNVIIENTRFIDCAASEHGFYYEFGAADDNSSSNPEDWSSSHASNLRIINTYGKDLKSDGSGGALISLIGAYNSLVEGVEVDGAFGAVEFRPGEAMFYRVWEENLIGEKRGTTIRKVVGRNLTGSGISCVGAQTNANGYLAGIAMTASDKVDLMSFVLEDISVESAGNGIFVSGPVLGRNIKIRGDCGSGGLILGDECVQFDLSLLDIRDGESLGIRAGFGDNIFTTARKKIGKISASKICGNTGAGIALDDTESVRVENCQLGYNTAYDAASESTQTAGISAATDAYGVVADGCYVTTSGSALAYVNIGSGDRGNTILNARGTRTYTAGGWKNDGVAEANSTALGDDGDIINTSNKYAGKLVWDTSNDRMLRALGPGPTDGWRLVDGSGTVTPS